MKEQINETIEEKIVEKMEEFSIDNISRYIKEMEEMTILYNIKKCDEGNFIATLLNKIPKTIKSTILKDIIDNNIEINIGNFILILNKRYNIGNQNSYQKLIKDKKELQLKDIDDLEKFEQIYFNHLSSEKEEHIVQHLLIESKALFKENISHKLFLSRIQSNESALKSYQTTKSILLLSLQEDNTESNILWTNNSYRKTIRGKNNKAKGKKGKGKSKGKGKKGKNSKGATNNDYNSYKKDQSYGKTYNATEKQENTNDESNHQEVNQATNQDETDWSEINWAEEWSQNDWSLFEDSH